MEVWGWLVTFVHMSFEGFADMLDTVSTHLDPATDLYYLVTAVLASACLTVFILVVGFCLQVMANLMGVVFRRESPRRIK